MVNTSHRPNLPCLWQLEMSFWLSICWKELFQMILIFKEGWNNHRAVASMDFWSIVTHWANDIPRLESATKQGRQPHQKTEWLWSSVVDDSFGGDVSQHWLEIVIFYELGNPIWTSNAKEWHRFLNTQQLAFGKPTTGEDVLQNWFVSKRIFPILCPIF